MSIATEIQRLQGIKSEIMAALERKNVDTTGKNMSDVGDLIRSIEVKPEGAVIGGRTYRTVTIGNQEWLAENLDFKTSGIEIAPSSLPYTPAAWYYNNDEATYGVNGNKYGLLYNEYAVKYLNDNRATLMPGWHISTKQDWDDLIIAIGGNTNSGLKLKSSSGWNSGNGNDSYNFSVFPVGIFDGTFRYIGTRGYFWLAESSTDGCIIFNTSASLVNSTSQPRHGHSVRLVKDA